MRKGVIAGAALVAALTGAAVTGLATADPADAALSRAAMMMGRNWGAIAVDRTGRFEYGYAFDHGSPSSARAAALQECRRRGSDCRIVLEFTGQGCVAYNTVDPREGTVFGWGSGPSRAAAQSRSQAECDARARGASCGRFVWTCQSSDNEPIRVTRTP